MRLVSYRLRDRTTVGAVVEGNVIDLAPALNPLAARSAFPCVVDLLWLLRAGDEGLDAVSACLDQVGAASACPALSDAELLAPIPRPPKIVAVGRNFADHAARPASSRSKHRASSPSRRHRSLLPGPSSRVPREW